MIKDMLKGVENIDSNKNVIHKQKKQIECFIKKLER